MAKLCPSEPGLSITGFRLRADIVPPMRRRRARVTSRTISELWHERQALAEWIEGADLHEHALTEQFDILWRLDDVISRYFPEFERELLRYLSRS
jgi:hypothetical protein